MAVLAGKLEARRPDCAAVAGKSTLNRLELSKPEPSRYHKISYDAEAVDRLFVDLFLDAHRTAPRQITLDLDATDDPLHGEQEGRFFHGYYKSYCYLPLYIFCGRHLLCAKLRRSNIDASAGSVEEVARIVAQIRGRWPKVRILLRGGFGVHTRRSDDMVRTERRRLSVRPGQKQQADRRDRGRALPRPPRRTGKAASRPGASRTSNTGRARAGAGSGAWWKGRVDDPVHSRE